MGHIDQWIKVIKLLAIALGPRLMPGVAMSEQSLPIYSYVVCAWTWFIFHKIFEQYLSIFLMTMTNIMYGDIHSWYDNVAETEDVQEHKVVLFTQKR